jgi:hypothetical protein
LQFLAFQEIEHYECPVWPEERGRQQQMLRRKYAAGLIAPL